MTQETLLLLGAGPRVGLATVHEFKAHGFKVAVVARKPIAELAAAADRVVVADFEEPGAMERIFEEVGREVGVPGVVIYNAYSWSHAEDPASPLTIPLPGFLKDLTVNMASAYAAAQEAVKGFARLPASSRTIFIYTGNRGNTCVNGAAMGLGLSKNAAWYMVQCAAAAYEEAGYRFYYVDERTPAGQGMRWISGEAHAKAFWEVACREGQGPALWTFVRGLGYRAFEGEESFYLPKLEMSELADLEYGQES